MRSALVSALTLFALTAIAAPSEKRQDKFSPCKNFGDEWCSEGEIVTCKQVPFSNQGWVKSTHKACAAKREEKRDVGDPCNKIGDTWCQDFEVLTCKESGIPSRWGRIASTGVVCGTKLKPEEKRAVNDVCVDIGTTWCVAGMIQMCALNSNGIGGHVAATNFNCLNQ